MNNRFNIKTVFVVVALGLGLVTKGQATSAQDSATENTTESAPEKKLTTEVSGLMKGDYRYFPKESLYPGQHQSYFSSVFQPEVYLEWADGNQLIQFKGFARLDQYDTQRTHADVRELYYQSIFKSWELSIGAKQVFWGVTESNHLVDIVNQGDALEGFDVEQKLGQPMVQVSISKNWGTLDLYGMTVFRGMQFPGPQGRFRPPFNIDEDGTTYESDMDEYNPDVAARWSHSKGVFDFALSHFYGTSRLPLISTTDGTTFAFHYELMHQTGFELQASTGSMLWKGEAIHRESKRKAITAFTVGGEYTFGNLFRKGADLGLIAEYNYDDRGQELISGMNDDFFFGARLAANDRQSTDFLGGLILDRENGTIRYFAKANRRVGESWKASIDVSGFNNIDPSEFIYLLRNDGYLQFSLAKYF